MAMRIRLHFAGNTHCQPTSSLADQEVTGAFIVLLLLASYIGLTPIQIPQLNDKLLHFSTFFLITVSCIHLNTVLSPT